MRLREINIKLRSTVAESKGTLWRVIQSEATGRYHVVKGYNKDIKMFKNKMGAGDFNSKESAQEKADELNKGVAEGLLNELSKDTLKSYTKKANDEVNVIKKKRADDPRGRISGADFDKKQKRQIGLTQASRRIEKKDLTGVAEGQDKKELPGAFGNIKIMTPQEFVSGAKNVDEATTLAAPTRPIGEPELTDYLDRIRNREKKKTDKYKLPYIHRSSVVSYYNEEGKKYNVDAIKNALGQKPDKLLKKNEKMKHSDGTDEQFFNIGFAALVGIALDKNTNELIIVNTCPGAGSCKIDCFAMKGGKVQFQGPWLSDGRILTYLLNDPAVFFNQLKTEITKEVVKGKKGNYKVSIRWHDAGDFFSPEYAAMAFKLAKDLPEVDFYAYTKVADVALGEKPKNFIINWSEGASSSQEKKVKASDPGLETTKNSRIVPSNLFYDLLVKDEKKNLVKGKEGQWQVIPDKLPELKQRLASQYGISANSILSYKEWEAKGKNNPMMKWNVIITPGEPDLTAKDPGVLSTLLLKH